MVCTRKDHFSLPKDKVSALSHQTNPKSVPQIQVPSANKIGESMCLLVVAFFKLPGLNLQRPKVPSAPLGNMLHASRPCLPNCPSGC